MEITSETLRRFVSAHGLVSIVDSEGQTRKLKVKDPDVWELAEKADRFRFKRRWYGRAAFEKLMDARMNPKPSNVCFVSMDTIQHEMPDLETDPKFKKK